MLKCFPCLCLLLVATSVHAQTKSEWPQFLGPNRNGISAETGLLDSWPKAGPKELWRVKGGIGVSGFAISRGRAVTMIQTAGKQDVLCLDAETGKTLWQTHVAPECSNGRGDGPRATPTIVGERIFVYTGDGVLAALNFADGKILWSHNILEEHNARPAEYGTACSPLVAGNNVVVVIGAPQASVVAYDAKSGELTWKAGTKDPTGYSSPALLEVGGKQQVVAFTGNSLLGIAPKTGGVLWRYPYETDFDCNIVTPLGIKGHVFISAGENHGSVLLKLSPSGEKFDISEVWASQGVKSVLRNEWQTSVLLDGYLYGFDNVGGAGPISHLTCIDAATGERAWQQIRFGKGNMIAADGKLIICTFEGDLVVARASPKGYEELCRMPVIGSTRQAPALCDGLVYLRDDDELVCVDLRKE